MSGQARQPQNRLVLTPPSPLQLHGALLYSQQTQATQSKKSTETQQLLSFHKLSTTRKFSISLTHTAVHPYVHTYTNMHTFAHTHCHAHIHAHTHCHIHCLEIDDARQLNKTTIKQEGHMLVDSGDSPIQATVTPIFCETSCDLDYGRWSLNTT